MRRVVLNGPADLSGFRRQARALAAAGVHPDDVVWSTHEEPEDLFSGAQSDAPADTPAVAPASPRFTVPAGFVRLCDSALLHRDPQRFALMYRLLCRLKESPSMWMDTMDPERRRAEQMAREVRRAIHKMHAFVRFFRLRMNRASNTSPGLNRIISSKKRRRHSLHAALPICVGPS